MGIASQKSVVLVKAGTLVDSDNVLLSPGAILLEQHIFGWKILAIGSGEEVQRHPAAASAMVHDRMDSVVCPGLANAHTHLDLTHIGPWRLPESGGFSDFIAKVRAERKTEEADIRASVRLGIEASRRGGVVAVGDIGGAVAGMPQLAPWRELRASPLAGVSYMEFFAIGSRENVGIERMKQIFAQGVEENAASGFSLMFQGVHPHAPYSVSAAGFDAAIRLSLMTPAISVCTHVGETMEERQFVQRGDGPLRAFLESVGLWNGLPEGIGKGSTPIQHVRSRRSSQGLHLIHANDLTDQDIELLSVSPEWMSVIFCPRSSEYFGAEKIFGPHRYRDLIQSGIRVGLGTDSIVNLVDQTQDSPRISTWDEMKLLFRRDATEPRLLLRMATKWAASAMWTVKDYFDLRVGSQVLDLVGVQLPLGKGGLAEALEGDGSPELLLNRK